MDSTVQTLAVLIISVSLVINLLVIQSIRQRRNLFTLRRIKAIDILPDFTGAGIESSRPLHLSLGSAAIGGTTTTLALASAEMFYHLTYEVAIGDALPIITASDTSVLPVGLDTLRRAYVARGLGKRFKPHFIRWYPAGSRSLAFAAAISAMQADDRISANVFAGSQGAELALMLDAAFRRGIPSVATSDQLEGQAIAYALADGALIGEEVYVAGGYFSERANQIGLAVTTDFLRWILIAIILFLMITSLVQQ